MRRATMSGVAAAVLLGLAAEARPGRAQVPAGTNWITATAYAIPREAAPQGEGYLALVERRNGRLYIGTIGGLWRLDGTRLVLVSARDEVFTSGDRFHVQATAEGALWILAGG